MLVNDKTWRAYTKKHLCLFILVRTLLHFIILSFKSVYLINLLLKTKFRFTFSLGLDKMVQRNKPKIFWCFLLKNKYKILKKLFTTALKFKVWINCVLKCQTSISLSTVDTRQSAQMNTGTYSCYLFVVFVKYYFVLLSILCTDT